MFYGLLNNVYDLDYSLFITLVDFVSTRGHPFKIFKQQLLRDVRAHVFSQQIIKNLNKLKTGIVIAPTLSIFKQLHDKYHSDYLYVAGL